MLRRRAVATVVTRLLLLLLLRGRLVTALLRLLRLRLWWRCSLLLQGRGAGGPLLLSGFLLLGMEVCRTLELYCLVARTRRASGAIVG